MDQFVDEFERNYRRVDGYSLKSRLREARERAGTRRTDLLAARLIGRADPRLARFGVDRHRAVA